MAELNARLWLTILCILMALSLGFIFAYAGGGQTTKEEAPLHVIDGVGGYKYAVYSDKCVRILKSPRSTRAMPKICSGKAWRAIMVELSGRVEEPKTTKRPHRTEKQPRRLAQRQPEAPATERKPSKSNNESENVWGNRNYDAYVSKYASNKTAFEAAANKPQPTQPVGKAQLNGTPSVLGARLPAALARTLRQNMPALQECYRQHSLKDLGSRTGQVDVRLDVTRKGRVRKPAISRSSFRNAPFHNCLLSNIRQIPFGSSVDGGVNIVTFTLGFSR